ncbi:tubulin alpha-8 chain-like [Watersipora subatra]|uniref:tubulin alpha-8 chain-like n=1 Tax=Watersipora subatra TaxID=2589382 RepID=UPI00355C80FD
MLLLSRESTLIKLRIVLVQADLNRGVVNIHLGQCGVQIADSLWELFCLEHDVCADGTIKKTRRKNLDLSTNGIFFEECSKGKYVPRTVILDTEPTVVDVIRTGRKRDLFRPDCLISGKEDSGNVFARGYFAMADDLRDLALDRIRKVVEGCSSVQGFSLFRSYSGGTGSGFGSALATSLRDDYPKTTQIEIATVPSGQYATAVVEPYNAVFSTHESLMNSDCAIFFDNEALYNMLSRQLDMESPSYKDINRMIAQAFDKVPHQLLIHKLKAYRFDTGTLKWIEAWLRNRASVVQVNGYTSHNFSIKSGVPQGSVLGPLLFILYIDDLPLCVKDADCRLYADDTLLCMDLTNTSQLALQTNVTALQHWATQWGMTFNPEKCIHMQIVSAMTAGLRFASTLKIDFTEVQTNLVPYPRLHFPVASISPILPRHASSKRMSQVSCFP